MHHIPEIRATGSPPFESMNCPAIYRFLSPGRLNGSELSFDPANPMYIPFHAPVYLS